MIQDATEMRSRETPIVGGEKMPIIAAPNSMPICDRMIRYTSSCRRDTGAGNRNCCSASENSSMLLSIGNSQAPAAAIISARPPRLGATASSAAIDCGRRGGRPPRRAALERDVRKRAKKLKYRYAAPAIAPMKYRGCRSRCRRTRSLFRKLQTMM